MKPVSFSAGPGDVIQILGDNGTGKTTLLDCIAGNYSQWTGTVWVRGSSLSYLRQDRTQFESLSLDQLADLIKDQSHDDFLEIVGDLQLEEVRSTPLGVLAGGEVRRAMLAIALVHKHEILLLDEPMVGIDPYSVERISDALQRSQMRRATILVEHRPAVPVWPNRVVRLEQP
jgi:ABC-type multidrug transport system ATPase subunit